MNFLSIKTKTKSYIIIPSYINCNHWDQDFNALYSFIEHNGIDDVMIIGDLNARIGKEEGRENRFAGKTRNSKDTTTNARGIKLLELCNSFGFRIMNGASRSDTCGEFTFVGQQGCSVIDFCLVRGNWIAAVADLEVLAAPYSDHMPIAVEFNSNQTTNDQTIRLIFPPKLIWKDSRAEEYRRNLERIIQTGGPLTNNSLSNS